MIICGPSRLGPRYHSYCNNHKSEKESNENGKIYDILLKVACNINLIVFHIFLIFWDFYLK